MRETAGAADGEHGLYVYGVVRATTASEEITADVRGVDPDLPIRFVADGEVAALANVVSLAEFGTEAIEQNLRDPGWLAEKVRAHDSVLNALLPHGALVPFRFGAIFRDEEQVRRMLRSQTRLPASLDRLEGAVELGVKGFLDAEQFARALRSDEPVDPAAAGRAYLLRKQAERRLAEEREAFSAQLATTTHEQLALGSREARMNPLQRPEAAGDRGEMFLNGAYLVEQGATETFRSRLDELRRSHADDGARYELTGPWPPYNFADEDEAA